MALPIILSLRIVGGRLKNVGSRISDARMITLGPRSGLRQDLRSLTPASMKEEVGSARGEARRLTAEKLYLLWVGSRRPKYQPRELTSSDFRNFLATRAKQSSSHNRHNLEDVFLTFTKIDISARLSNFFHSATIEIEI